MFSNFDGVFLPFHFYPRVGAHSELDLSYSLTKHAEIFRICPHSNCPQNDRHRFVVSSISKFFWWTKFSFWLIFYNINLKNRPPRKKLKKKNPTWHSELWYLFYTYTKFQHSRSAQFWAAPFLWIASNSRFRPPRGPPGDLFFFALQMFISLQC